MVKVSIYLNRRVFVMDSLSYFSIKTYVVGTH